MDETPERTHTTIVDVVRDVFRDFPTFAKRYLAGDTPPAIILVIWLLGMDAVAGAMELEFVQSGTYAVNNWFHAWLRIMGMGILLGTARYWIVGTLFHGIVHLAGGRGPMRTSRYIFLYSALPVVVVDLLLKVFQMIHYGNDYFTGQTSVALEGAIGGVVLVAYLYTARLCYQGMCLLMGADRLRSALLIGTIALLLVAGVAVIMLAG